MPLIRRPKSKRVKINDREKRKKQIKESKKKAKKHAKKNPQWKSRNPKDPGMPNSWPYKDQILAEAEVARSEEAAEQQRQRQLLKNALKTSEVEQFSGITIIETKARTTSGFLPKPTVEDEDSDDEEEEIPLLMDPELPDLEAVLDKADVIVHVLDARDPASHRVPSLEKRAQEKGKKIIFLLNKIDIVPREAASAWLTSLRLQYPTLPFRSAAAFLPPPPSTQPTKRKEKQPADDAVGLDAFKEYLFQRASEQKDALRVAFVGMTNSGKSSVINSLVQTSITKVYRLKSDPNVKNRVTTLYPITIENKLEIKGRPVTLIDTPGFTLKMPTDVSKDDELLLEGKDVYLRRFGYFERIREPIPAASHIIQRAQPEDLMVLYNAPAFSSSDPKSILTSLARVSGRLGKKGVPDIKSAALMVLRDYRTGHLSLYSLPPKPSTTLAPNPELQALYAQTDTPVLEKLQALKQLVVGENARNLVRLKTGDPWTGDVDLKARHEPEVPKSKRRRNRNEDLDDFDDVDGMELDDDEEESSEDDEGSDSEDVDMDEEAEEWTGFGNDEGEGEDEDSDSPPLPSKRKQPLAKANKPTKKTVKFASKPLPPSSKENKPSAKAFNSIMKTSSMPLKVANEGAAKAHATSKKVAVANGEQPYDFSAHFKGA